MVEMLQKQEKKTKSANKQKNKRKHIQAQNYSTTIHKDKNNKHAKQTI